MGVHHHKKPTATNNLVFSVDPGNKLCDNIANVRNMVNPLETGTFINGASVVDDAYSLDGIGKYIDFGNIVTAPTVSNLISITSWVVLGDISTDPENNSSSYMVAKTNSAGGADKSFALSIKDGISKSIQWQVGEVDTNNYIITTGEILNEGQPYHIVITHEGTLPNGSDYGKIYVNGIEVAVTTMINITGNMGESATPFLIGAGNQPVGRFLLADLGPIKIYKGILTPEEILQNFNSQKSRYGM